MTMIANITNAGSIAERIGNTRRAGEPGPPILYTDDYLLFSVVECHPPFCRVTKQLWFQCVSPLPTERGMCVCVC